MSDMVECSARGAGPRVLQILPGLGEGGAESGAIDLARYMTAQGWTPIVASHGGRGETELRELGVTTRRLPLHAKNPVILANVRRLQALVREFGVQLIHARSRAAAWSGYYAARRCGIPFVTTFHGIYSGSDRFFKHRYNRIMARGDRVIAVSEHVACHLRERYGVEASRLRVIPRGIDLDRFAAAAVGQDRLDALVRHWNLRAQAPRRTKIVMLPGRLTRIKGHLLLLEAIGQMERRNFTCLLVGGLNRQSRYVREIEGQIERRGLGKVVRLVGGCRDMPAALALADVVVVPSIGPEALGRVSLEAQALGKPVVATNIGGLGETLVPASTGWLVPPGDPAELARALELALAMPDDARARLAIRARRLVERRFGAEGMTASTLAVYRELLTENRPTHVQP